jgi:hypothetical protein
MAQTPQTTQEPMQRGRADFLAQPSPSEQNSPAPSATPNTDQPINVEELGEPIDDAQWNTVQKASGKLLKLLTKAGVFVGGMIHTDGPIERKWIEDEYVCQYNSDDFTLTLTDFNGSTDYYSLYPSGEIWTQKGGILGTVNSDGDITRINQQDDIDYRRWVTGGGEPGYEVWRSLGKPKAFNSSIALNRGIGDVSNPNFMGSRLAPNNQMVGLKCC